MTHNSQSGVRMKARVLRAMKFAAYRCANGHRFAVDIGSEPPHYVVRCPVCDVTRVEEL